MLSVCRPGTRYRLNQLKIMKTKARFFLKKNERSVKNKSSGNAKLAIPRFLRGKTAHSEAIANPWESSMEGIFGLNCRPSWGTKGRLRRSNNVYFVVFERPKDLETL